MMDKIKDQYNSLYKNNKVTFGKGKPVPSVIELNKYINKGTVLDIGGGEGRNALYLASKGFDITVLDLSEVGLDKIKDANKNIKTKVSDVTKDEIAGEYDVIINTFVLHHMSLGDAKKVILKSKKSTKKKGISIVVTFANNGGLFDRNTKSERFYPDENLIRKLYSDWEIKELNIYETTTLAKDKERKNMVNDVISIIAVNH